MRCVSASDPARFRDLEHAIKAARSGAEGRFLAIKEREEQEAALHPQLPSLT